MLKPEHCYDPLPCQKLDIYPGLSGGYFACSSLVLYGIRIGGFHARKGSIMGRPCVPKPLVGGFGCDELVLYGIIEPYVSGICILHKS